MAPRFKWSKLLPRYHIVWQSCADWLSYQNSESQHNRYRYRVRSSDTTWRSMVQGTCERAKMRRADMVQSNRKPVSVRHPIRFPYPGWRRVPSVSNWTSKTIRTCPRSRPDHYKTKWICAALLSWVRFSSPDAFCSYIIFINSQSDSGHSWGFKILPAKLQSAYIW